MDKAALKAELDAALKNFVDETKHLDDYSQAPVTEGELKEVVRQTHLGTTSLSISTSLPEGGGPFPHSLSPPFFHAAVEPDNYFPDTIIANFSSKLFERLHMG